MTFLVLLATLVIDRLYDFHKQYRHFDWFNQWQSWLQTGLFKDNDDWVFHAVSLIFPLWLLSIVLGFFLDFNSIVSLLVSIFILLLSIGPIDFDDSVDQYIHAKKSNDAQLASHYASLLIYDENKDLNEVEEVKVTRSLLYCSVEHFFATLFWFVIIGPVAALFFRLILQNYINNRDSHRAKTVLAWAIYIPTYLVSFSFALVGSFEQTIKKLQNINEYATDLLTKCRQITVASGCAALNMNMSAPDYMDELNSSKIYLIENARAIILRALVVWLSVVLIVELSQLSLG